MLLASGSLDVVGVKCDDLSDNVCSRVNAIVAV